MVPNRHHIFFVKRCPNGTVSSLSGPPNTGAGKAAKEGFG